MKIAIIGAAGLRTPLIIRSIIARQANLGVHELALMDIDGDRLDLIGKLTRSIEESQAFSVRILRTTDPIKALTAADFVITTFRVGGIESRAIDERVPLDHHILGQETTGAGGFAMGLRSIPVMLNYVDLMKEYCPEAWLINFANPAGMLVEAVIRNSGWSRSVGICDGPATMTDLISIVLKAQPDEVYLDYFGLNHLGWIRKVTYRNQNYMPFLMDLISSSDAGKILPFDPELIISLGLIPNEYLYYYYYAKHAVSNILKAKESRGEQIARLNASLIEELRTKTILHDDAALQAVYQSYLTKRGMSYMVSETGKTHVSINHDQADDPSVIGEGYAGVALDLVEALMGNKPKIQILNIPNRGAISGMEDMDVVEIPALVGRDHIQPLAVGEIPAHCLGLVLQVKKYEKLTIEAAVEASYDKARMALTLHPLVGDYKVAGSILDEYIKRHKGNFPELN
jgi:6-phospho-beta-glucosidase